MVHVLEEMRNVKIQISLFHQNRQFQNGGLSQFEEMKNCSKNVKKNTNLNILALNVGQKRPVGDKIVSCWTFWVIFSLQNHPNAKTVHDS